MAELGIAKGRRLSRHSLLVACWTALVAWLASVPSGWGEAAEPESSGSKPNIVIFIADDLSWHDVACFGGPTSARTPNLDKFAREGMKLTGFFSPASVCSPTRQALLTGLYPVRSGAYPNHAVVRPGTKSLPTHLGSLGYRTAVVGKQHYGPAASYPFDEELSLRDESQGDDRLPLEQMEQFVRAERDRPFCLYIATKEPHGPHTLGDQSAYDPDTLIVPPYLVDTPETRRGLAAYYAEVTCMESSSATCCGCSPTPATRTTTRWCSFSANRAIRCRTASGPATTSASGWRRSRGGRG